MANFPQSPQYPQPPMYPPPGPMAQPTRPTAMQRAVSLMYAGAAVSVINGVVTGLTSHNVTFYVYSSTSSTTTVHNSSSLVAGIIGGIISAGLWMWMAWKAGAGRNWARVLSSVFFGFACLGFLGNLISLAGSGSALAFIVFLVEWGVGLAALIHLWKRESSEFFAFAKAAGAYGPAYPGSQPPGYGQPPQYGQSGYGQPPQ
jgi:hypothetical protein